MSDHLASHTTTVSMPLAEADISRLARLVEGLVDADILLAEEGEALLQPIEAARESLERGDATAARRHILRVAAAANSLLRSNALGPAEALAVVQATGRILAPDTSSSSIAQHASPTTESERTRP